MIVGCRNRPSLQENDHVYHQNLFGLAVTCRLLKSLAVCASDDTAIIRHEFIYEKKQHPIPNAMLRR